MKKITVLTAIFLTLSLLTSFAAPSFADGERVGYSAKEVTTYLYGMDNSEKMTVISPAGMPELILIGVDDFLSKVFEIESVCERTGDGAFTFTKSEKTMTVFPGTDAIIFDLYEDFCLDGAYSEGSMLEANYILTEKVEYQGEPLPLTIDLAKYGVDIVEYDDRPFISLSALNTIFCVTYNAAEYIDGALYFFHSSESDGYYDRSPVYETLTRSQAMADYAYRELCMTIDLFFGRPANAEISKSIGEKGFDKTLDEYSDVTREAKRLLKSTSKVDFYAGLCCLAPLFEDGGHTALGYDPFGAAGSFPNSAFAKAWVKAVTDSDRAEMLLASLDAENMSYLKWAVTSALRSTKLREYTPVNEWKDADAALYVKGDTALFVFDYFVNEMVEPLRWSLEYAKEHKLKNFAIDISTNGGGSSDVAMYVLAAITCKTTGTNEVALDIASTLTVNMFRTSSLVDLNLDGKFDEKDRETVYDFNFAILTSSNSFSCGNLLPFLAKEYGIAIIGERSGGGECAVCRFFTPESAWVHMSMPLRFKVGEGSLDEGAAVDIAVCAPVKNQALLRMLGVDDPDAFGLYDFSEMYDIENVGGLIEGYYNGGVPETGDDGVQIRIAAAAAFASLCVFACAVTRRRRREE